MDKETAEKLIPIINQLPKRYKDVVYSMIVEQSCYYQVAQKLKLNEKTTRTRVQRGMIKVGELLMLPENNKLVSEEIRSKAISLIYGTTKNLLDVLNRNVSKLL